MSIEATEEVLFEVLRKMNLIDVVIDENRYLGNKREN